MSCKKGCLKMYNGNSSDAESMDNTMPALAVFHLRINPYAVFFVKYIIEAYDNLYQITTLDIETGLVEIKAAAGTCTQLVEILNSFAKRTGLDCLRLVSQSASCRTN